MQHIRYYQKTCYLQVNIKWEKNGLFAHILLIQMYKNVSLWNLSQDFFSIYLVFFYSLFGKVRDFLNLFYSHSKTPEKGNTKNLSKGICEYRIKPTKSLIYTSDIKLYIFQICAEVDKRVYLSIFSFFFHNYYIDFHIFLCFGYLFVFLRVYSNWRLLAHLSPYSVPRLHSHQREKSFVILKGGLKQL